MGIKSKKTLNIKCFLKNPESLVGILEELDTLGCKGPKEAFQYINKFMSSNYEARLTEEEDKTTLIIKDKTNRIYN